MKNIKYSIIKIFIIEFIISILTLWPMLDSFSNDLVYMTLLFKPGFSIFRIFAEIIGVFMFLYFIPLLISAIRGAPMVVFGDDWLKLNLVRTRHLDFITIKSIERQNYGNVIIYIDDAPPAIVPIFLSKNSKDSFNLLKKITDKQNL